uniref:RRM domain-containing protein n=1 Tax=Populus trichocarpa TaxID=3694 RepID=B9NA53_POPTR
MEKMVMKLLNQRNKSFAKRGLQSTVILSQNQDKSGQHINITVPSFWMCTSYGCVNFAWRTSCLQCNEPRTDDAPAADLRQEMLRYEFSKHAPIKDLRLVRDKFTHVSRGFAFVHFHSVDDATNGTSHLKRGTRKEHSWPRGIRIVAVKQLLQLRQRRLHNTCGQEQAGGEITVQKDGSAPQPGFWWDEASGYYYDAASGFYFDGNTCLYYDANQGVWYSYDQQAHQYILLLSQITTTIKHLVPVLYGKEMFLG